MSKAYKAPIFVFFFSLAGCVDIKLLVYKIGLLIRGSTLLNFKSITLFDPL